MAVPILTQHSNHTSALAIKWNAQYNWKRDEKVFFFVCFNHFWVALQLLSSIIIEGIVLCNITITHKVPFKTEAINNSLAEALVHDVPLLVK